MGRRKEEPLPLETPKRKAARTPDARENQLISLAYDLAEQRLLRGQTEDVAYFVPFYLKDFVAKTPKKLI